jgi:hypothetical protein
MSQFSLGLANEGQARSAIGLPRIGGVIRKLPGWSLTMRCSPTVAPTDLSPRAQLPSASIAPTAARP